MENKARTYFVFAQVGKSFIHELGNGTFCYLKKLKQ